MKDAADDREDKLDSLCECGSLWARVRAEVGAKCAEACDDWDMVLDESSAQWIVRCIANGLIKEDLVGRCKPRELLKDFS